ncbi:hypothetical protein OD91_1560 [Lutibacter sp. Hel_I_33_5]|uniref:hypothetical protein n=1 Tax=Lutibacter sp. Hel_I_33_5 TaxID=1566289 RepID=UPI0011A55C6C|nr:hypothetical protein [Lutibacter sp. Hel_I_33_5]TVZ56277.1 hypothetical protein OD91_1560 [Lutibacter sp. Hel_I_33_5]
MINGFLMYFNVISCFGDCHNSSSFTFMELTFFGIISFFLVSFLLWYYNNIPKSNFNENETEIELKASRLPRLILYLSIVIPSIILLIDFFNFGNLFTSFDIFMLCSVVTLILYFSITPKVKKRFKRQKLDNPIYQSKDILLQSKSLDANFIIAEKTTSIWMKIFVFVLIGIVAVTPLYELLNTGYFL